MVSIKGVKSLVLLVFFLLFPMISAIDDQYITTFTNGNVSANYIYGGPGSFYNNISLFYQSYIKSATVQVNVARKNLSCVQNWWNLSTNCGGKDKGWLDDDDRAQWSDFDNAFDNDWDTFGTINPGFDTHIYYERPDNQNTYGNFWQIKTANWNLNFSIHPDCILYNVTHIDLYILGGAPTLYQCRNSSNKYVPLGNSTTTSIYEESVHWEAGKFPTNISIAYLNKTLYLNNSIFNESKTVDLNTTVLIEFMQSSCPVLSNYYCKYNLNFSSQTGGLLNYTNLNITYTPPNFNNCSDSNTTTLNISFYDHTNASINVNYEATTTFFNSTLLNGTFSMEHPSIHNVLYCIYPPWAELTVDQQNRYQYQGTYFDYNLYQNVLNNVTQHISLYTQNGTTRILFTVQDLNSEPLINAYIHVLAYDVGTGTYKTTEIIKTDTQGQGVGNAVLYSTFYNFLIYYEGSLIYTEQAVKLVTNTRTFTITLESQAWSDQFETALGINYDLYFNDATNNFVFTWSDPTAAMHYGCLRVDLLNITGTTTLTDACTQSASGTILYGVTLNNGTTYTATGYIKFDTPFILNIIQKFTSPVFHLYYSQPLLALFIATLLMIALFMIGIPHPVVSLTLLCIGLIICFYLGLLAIGFVYIGGIIGLAVVQMILAKR